MIAITGYTGLIGCSLGDKMAWDDTLLIGRDWEDVDSHADILIHCAGPLETEDPKEMFKRCWRFNELLLRMAEKGLEKVIYLSTMSKRNDYYTMAHRLCERFVAHSGVPYVILRLSNVYGLPTKEKNFRWHLVPYSFPAQAFYWQDIKVRNPHDVINFVSLFSVVKRIISAVTQDEVNSISVVTGPDDIHVVDFAELCADVYSSKFGNSIGNVYCEVGPNRGSMCYTSTSLRNFLNELYSRFEGGYYEDVLKGRF